VVVALICLCLCLWIGGFRTVRVHSRVPCGRCGGVIHFSIVVHTYPGCLELRRKFSSLSERQHTLPLHSYTSSCTVYVDATRVDTRVRCFWDNVRVAARCLFSPSQHIPIRPSGSIGSPGGHACGYLHTPSTRHA
jgi:hypothetical protein